jgi:hypothetical protein
MGTVRFVNFVANFGDETGMWPCGLNVRKESDRGDPRN